MTCITDHRSDTKTLQWGCSLYVGRALWDSFLRSELKVFVTSIFGLISDIPLALQLHSFRCTEQFLLWQTCPECLMLHVRWAFVASHPVPQWPQETCKGPSLVFVLVMQHGRHFHCVKYLPLNTTHISYHLIPCPGTQLTTVTLWGSVHCYRFIVFWKLLEQTSFCSSEIFLFFIPFLPNLHTRAATNYRLLMKSPSQFPRAYIWITVQNPTNYLLSWQTKKSLKLHMLKKYIKKDISSEPFNTKWCPCM